MVMAYEDMINTVYNNLNGIPDISYDNIQDILKILVDVSEYIKCLEEKTDDLELEVRELKRDVLNLEMENK